MKFFYSILLSALFLSACTGTQNTSSADNNETEGNTTDELTPEQEREKVILAEGYSKCKVVDMGSQDECGFVLQDLNGNNLYKPLQWKDEFVNYRQDGNVVYIKFRGSKVTQTVCLQSMPIIVDEMKLVE